MKVPTPPCFFIFARFLTPQISGHWNWALKFFRNAGKYRTAQLLVPEY
jgi:hypothetical protein